MRKVLFSIESNRQVAAGTFRLELSAPGYEHSGEFVDVALPGFYLRRPISVADFGPGRITLIYKVVGEGTKLLSTLPAGSPLELLTGLGRGFDPARCTSKALLVGGGLGAAPLLPLCKELRAEGKEVTVVLGFNRAEEAVLTAEFRALGASLTVATMDGSLGVRGLVTDAIAAVRPEFDFFYTCGPLVMMKAVCNALPGGGQASLEERMGCGAGFCYGCSCHTVVGPRRICADGPVFDREEIIW